MTQGEAAGAEGRSQRSRIRPRRGQHHDLYPQSQGSSWGWAAVAIALMAACEIGSWNTVMWSFKSQNGHNVIWRFVSMGAWCSGITPA